MQAERTRDKNTAKRASQAALKSLVKRKGRYVLPAFTLYHPRTPALSLCCSLYLVVDSSRGGMLEDSEVEAVINGRGAGRGGEQKGKRNWKRDRKNEK